jgi:hypothetical protein
MANKIALCFLTYNNLSQPKLWKNFINSKYNIYIHNKDKFTGVFEQYCIKNKVETKWGDISLIKATLNLFKEAFQTEENEYFVLLSDKCIPLYGADEIYNKVKNLDNNLIAATGIDPPARGRYKFLADKTFFNENTFMKQHQWMVLKRDTVKFFIENDYTHIFGDNSIVSDEHYFINIINKFNISFINKMITYVNWNEKSDLTKYNKLPKTYSKLTNENIENILKSGTLFMRKVGPECNLPSYFDTFYFNKLNLINENRIDLIIGLEYVDFYENQYNTDFFINLYIEHKRAFNNLREGNWSKTWNTNTVKKGKRYFIDCFNNLIDDIKVTKTNKIPIPIYYDNHTYWIKDGFHRASILFYYDFLINKDIILKPMPFSTWYYPTNIYFFKKKNYDLKYCNYTMYNYLKNYHKDFHCIILFPNNKRLPKNLLNEIEKHIIYDIDIPMNNFKNNFKNNFIQLLYYTEGWCKNGGYKNKAQPCFNNGKNLKIYFVEKKELNILVDYKKKVREYYDKGKNSIHIPDTQKESDTLLDLLNYNTLSFMDKAPSLYINFPNFNKLFEKLKQFCEENNIDTKKICITSSSVLSVYGIRDCGDMDLFIDKKYIDIFKKTPFDNDNKYTIDKHYSKHFEDIIYNPDNHFYFQGIKFCNLSIILDYKKYRVKNNLYGKNSIEKDNRDINNIENILSYMKKDNQTNKKLTVLITTHYIPRQYICLNNTLKYLLKHFGEGEKYEILICNDSYNKSKNDIKKSEENIISLKSKYVFDWYHGKREFKFNNEVYNFKTVGCNILDLITRCNTDYFLFLEHDWIFTKKINVNNLLNLFELNKKINYIRFSLRNHPGPWDTKTKYIEELDLTSTNGFNNHPYISRRQFWNDFLIDKLIRNKVHFIEDCIHKYMKNESEKMGLYIYIKQIYKNPSNDSICIKHLDGSKYYNISSKGMTDEDLKNL